MRIDLFFGNRDILITFITTVWHIKYATTEQWNSASF